LLPCRIRGRNTVLSELRSLVDAGLLQLQLQVHCFSLDTSSNASPSCPYSSHAFIFEHKNYEMIDKRRTRIHLASHAPSFLILHSSIYFPRVFVDLPFVHSPISSIFLIHEPRHLRILPPCSYSKATPRSLVVLVCTDDCPSSDVRQQPLT
jgi:hypothetical protein